MSKRAIDFQKNAQYDSQIWICNNQQSYQQVNRGGEVMIKKKDIGIGEGRGHSNFCQGASMMEHEQDHYNHPNSNSISPQLNAILHPTSIFQSNKGPSRLDHYFKIKSIDKPKDTLKQIHAKKQAFIRYVNQPSPHQHPPHSLPLQNYTQQTTRIKQQFPQFTFYNNCKTNTLLFAKIIHSRIHKCNISITNLRGEVLKYYPNVILSKKEGKIINFISKNTHHFLFVFDYTATIDTIAKFPSILNGAPLLYYKLVGINNLDPRILEQVRQKLKAGDKGQLVNQDSSIIAKSKQLCQRPMLKFVSMACQKIKTIQQQQNAFLTATRGTKLQADCILAFDMMMVSLWKQYKLVGQGLINKIISLFELKQTMLEEMDVKQPPAFHAPQKMAQAQNCCFCLSTDPQIKRPKRTRAICQRCSALKEKHIYLCRDCFKLYHTQNNLYQFRKNQKKIKRKSKKKIKIVRKLGRKYATQNLQNEYDNNQIQEKPTENQMTLLKLDKKCDQFFEKIQELIEEGSLASSEYYLTMLMNMTILQTHKYVNKFCKKREDNIKIERD